MPIESYTLLLTNDRELHDAIHDDDPMAVYVRAASLYKAYHSNDGLTIEEQLMCIVEAVRYWTED